jgi:hypothetical protein
VPFLRKKKIRALAHKNKKIFKGKRGLAPQIERRIKNISN